MSPVDRINAVADMWARFCVDGLVQAAVGLLIVSLVWRLIHKSSASQLGYWLFLLVLLKPFIPIQVLIPDTLLTGHSVTASSTDAAAGKVDAIHNNVAHSVPIGSVAELTKGDFAVSVSAWLMLGWLAIVCLAFGRLAWIQARTRRLIRRSSPATPAERLEFDELARLAGIRRGTRLLWNRTITSPFAACASSPCIVIPRHLKVLLSREQLRWTLLHELAHVRRGDLWVMLIQSGIRTVLFFNPAIWVASFIVDQLREQSCDDEATSRSSISPTEAGRGFLKIVEFSGSDKRLLALGFHGTHRQIRSRMMRLIQANRSTRYRLTLPAKLALFAMALVVLPSVKAQEEGKDVSIRARIAALEAELQVLKGAVSEPEQGGEPDEGTAKKSAVRHRNVRTNQLEVRRGVTVTLAPERQAVVRETQLYLPFSKQAELHVELGFSGGSDVSLGSHKAKITSPGPGKQNYDVFDIDTSKMEKPGLLVIRVQMGKGDAAASFDLFPGDVSIPSDPAEQEQLRIEKSVAQLYDVPGGHSGTLIYHFKPGDKFKLGATGNWFSDEDATNTAKINAFGTDYSATIHNGQADGATVGFTTVNTDSEAGHPVIHVPIEASGTTTTRGRAVLIVPEADVEKTIP